jgi:hypothetical protein
VAAIATEEDDREHDYGHRQGHDHGNARWGNPTAWSRAFLLA